MTPEEAELDKEWRARFGQPLPMLGCAAIVRQILNRHRDDGDSSAQRAA